MPCCGVNFQPIQRRVAKFFSGIFLVQGEYKVKVTFSYLKLVNLKGAKLDHSFLTLPGFYRVRTEHFKGTFLIGFRIYGTIYLTH